MELAECPICKCPVRIMRREDGAADHYQYIDENKRGYLPNPIPPILADYLRAKRVGKRTVAIVGGAWSSGPWAPFGEDRVDIWTCNESHGKPWMKEEYITAWFQLHPKWVFTRDDPFDHREWIKKEHQFPVYMQMVYDDVPTSKKYPLREIQNELVNVERGEFVVNKIFSSTFSYMMALALYQEYERVEIYGIELLGEGEYAFQREALAYWIGKADGMGVEVWLPEQCSLLVQPLLYAYEEIRKGDTGVILSPPII